MGGPGTRSAARLAALAGALVLGGVSAATAAGPADSLRHDVGVLQSRTQHALLDLYALDTRLQAAQTRLTALQSQSAQLRSEEAALTQQLSAARQTLAVSQRALGANLRMLYKEGDVNALAVILGSQSLDEALTRLDDLNRTADESRQVASAASAAESQLVGVRAALADRRARIDAALAEAQQTAGALSDARAGRVALIGRLRSAARLKTAQIATLEARAQAALRKSTELQSAAAPAAAAPAAFTTSTATDPAPAPTTPAAAAPPAPALGRRLTVTSTGYSLRGRTSTGLPVGFGVVAVDPSVIPLGTRLTIPGYGEAVAADTGSSVHGDTIDLWFATLAQARAWGRRTVTITLH